MKKVFYTSLSVLIGALLLDYININRAICRTFFCHDGVEGTLLGLFVISVVIIFLCAVLRFLPNSCFTSWWKFAKFAIPLVLLVTVIISLGLDHNPGGWFNMDDEVDIVRMAIVFSLFFLGSVIQIIRGYGQK